MVQSVATGLEEKAAEETARSFGLALLLLFLAWPLAGQTSVELGPSLGYYLPTGSYGPATVFVVGLPSEPRDLKAGAWGGEARIWLGGQLGIQMQLAASSKQLGPFVTPAGTVGPTRVRTTAGSIQLVYAFFPDPGVYRLWVGVGPGVVRHGGDAYARVGSQTDLAGVIGLGGRIRIRGGFGVTAGVTALFYPYNVPMPAALRLNGESLQKGFQRDALFHAGVNWMWR